MVARSNRPAPSTEQVRSNMSRQRRRDTEPEMRLRRRLHAAGFRYRVDHPPITGLRRRADIVFTRKKIAIFVDGCFWHGCSEHKGKPKANAEWWTDKIAANVRRDEETTAKLIDAGWRVIRIWEHESLEAAEGRIVAELRSLSASIADTKQGR